MPTASPADNEAYRGSLCLAWQEAQTMTNHKYPQIPTMPHVMHLMDSPTYQWFGQRDMLFNPQLDPQEQGNYWERQHVYD